MDQQHNPSIKLYFFSSLLFPNMQYASASKHPSIQQKQHKTKAKQFIFTSLSCPFLLFRCCFRVLINTFSSLPIGNFLSMPPSLVAMQREHSHALVSAFCLLISFLETVNNIERYYRIALLWLMVFRRPLLAVAYVPSQNLWVSVSRQYICSCNRVADATRPDIVTNMRFSLTSLLIMKLLNALQTITSIVSDKKKSTTTTKTRQILISPHMGAQ